VQKDAKCSECEPKVEVRMVENESENEAEDRRYLAKHTAKEESGLYAAGVVVSDGAPHVLTAENE